MAQNTIVALYHSLADAENARLQLEAIGIPSSDIAVRAGGTSAGTSGAEASAGHGRSFFEWLFGAEAPQGDVERYRTHLGQDGGVLSVRADERDHDRIAAVLESTDLVAIEGAEEVTGTDNGAPAVAPMEGGTPAASEENVLPTAREELAVGKREVSDTRNYRIRRYVIERPAEADVTLHEERVVVERRAAGDVAPGGEPFEEREVEVAERHEEPVIGKRMIPGEEVVVRKEAQDRVETVRDKVRESKVEVDRAAAGDKPSSRNPKAG